MSQTAVVEEIYQDSHTDQYLTYQVSGEDYGVLILSVQEIRGWETVARVPNTPRYMKGVLNLRGTAVPILDMRMRMGHENPCYDNSTVVIILRASVNHAERVAGLVVDSVSDVMHASASEIRKTPDFGDRISTDFIKGLADVDGKMVMLLDADEFMQHPDIYEDREVKEE